MKVTHKELAQNILDYIQDFLDKKSSTKTPPSRITLLHHFKDKYPEEDVNQTIEELVSQNILKSYSFHEYLDFSPYYRERLKSSRNNV